MVERMNNLQLQALVRSLQELFLMRERERDEMNGVRVFRNTLRGPLGAPAAKVSFWSLFLDWEGGARHDRWCYSSHVAVCAATLLRLRGREYGFLPRELTSLPSLYPSCLLS